MSLDMTIIDYLIEVLESTEVCEEGRVFEQGSMTPEYPDKYFTFWNRDTYSRDYYDNREGAIVWEFDVNLYCANKPEHIERLEADFKKTLHALRENGFIFSGRGGSVASDEPSHRGRGITVRFIEREGI